MTKPVAKILVGLPASGKSTLVKKFLGENSEIFYYSTDAEIERLCDLSKLSYDEGFSIFIDEATKTLNTELEDAIKSLSDILWDQTNLGVKKRKKILNRLNKYRTECHCFLPPEEIDDIVELNRRLMSRPGKTIPDHVMKNMVKSYVIPSLDEGFDEIFFYDLFGKVV